MFCPNCGKQLPDGVKFCPNCGTQIPVMVTEAGTIAADMPQSVEEVPQAPQAPMAIPVPADTPSYDDQWVSGGYDEPEPASSVFEPASQTPAEVTYGSYAPIPETARMSVPEQVQSAGNVEATAVQTVPYTDIPMGQSTTYGDASVSQPSQPAKAKGLPLFAKVAVATLGVFLIASGGYRIISGFLGSDPEPSAINEPQIIEKVDGDHTTDLIPTDDNADKPSDQVEGSDDVPAQDGSDTQSVVPTTEGEFVEETLEEHGYPTIYAFMELSGSDLKRLVMDNGFTFYEGEDSDIWVNGDVTMVFNVVDTSGTLEEDGMDGKPAGFAGEPAIFVGVLEGYNSCADVLDGMARCTVEDSAADGKGNVVAVCHGPSMKRFLVFVQDVEDGDYQLTIYNQEAVDAGYVDVVHDGSFGTTMEQIFEGYAGRPFGQN